MRKPRDSRVRTDLDELGRSALHYAAAEGNLEEVARLLISGADPNLQDQQQWTPLHFAAQANSAPCVEELLRAGANPALRDSHGNTPLFRAVFASRGSGDVICALRAGGADPNAINSHGVSPVILARRIANYDVKRFFEDLPGV
jgi:uncharacterized protein